MAFPRGPPAPPHRAALRRAGGGGSGSAGSGGCGRWMAANQENHCKRDAKLELRLQKNK